MRLLFSLLLALLFLTACSEEKAPEPVRQADGIGNVIDEQGLNRPDFPALEYALRTDPASVIPAEALELVGGEAAYLESIPEGAEFDVVEDTWEPDGTGGTVRIRMLVEDEVVMDTVAVMLADERLHWFLLQTISLAPDPGPVVPQGENATPR